MDSRSEGAVEVPAEFVWSPQPKFQDRRGVQLTLLLLTIASTMLVGASHYAAFAADFSAGAPPAEVSLWSGLPYSVTILAILGCHELGHYLACRYYNVDASLPFFIPMPIFLTGTMGAFIRIREPFRTKAILFDIGIAGPIAGFLIAVPALVLGIAMSHVSRLPPNFVGFELGEPLLFKAVSWVFWGALPDGYALNMHPIAFAAWFGLLATALNLFPASQLDGGHIAYAVLGDRSSYVTVATIVAGAILTMFSSTWFVWTLVMLVLVLRFGRHHPPTFDAHVPLDRTRMVLAVAAAIMFILCFTPAPISSIDLIRG